MIVAGHTPHSFSKLHSHATVVGQLKANSLKSDWCKRNFEPDDSGGRKVDGTMKGVEGKRLGGVAYMSTLLSSTIELNPLDDNRFALMDMDRIKNFAFLGNVRVGGMSLCASLPTGRILLKS